MVSLRVLRCVSRFCDHQAIRIERPRFISRSPLLYKLTRNNCKSQISIHKNRVNNSATDCYDHHEYRQSYLFENFGKSMSRRSECLELGEFIVS
ncbi:hypothetical protein L596_027536 [Steinernema carpocapsae]|uniref:Uncharacterized protein n=1 Tax=Steinernema carpocapsae TaxID=34508 RepID=A0A4U5LVS6_STECR|nr:hypothetical protein L596_027536 [Steinernema carpocapsae]